MRLISKKLRLRSLENNIFALVDVEDFDRIIYQSWYLFDSHRVSYVRGRDGILLHRFVLDVSQDVEVDHVNHNGLDNRKSNLRVCTSRQNSMNCRGKRKWVGRASKYKGVCLHSCGLWQAEIRIYGKKQYIGLFTSEVHAARAYDYMATEFFGSFACLNFPVEAINEINF